MTAIGARYRYGSRGFVVTSDAVAPLAWLREFVEPWFEPAPQTPPSGDDADPVSVHLQLDPDLEGRLRRDASPVAGRPAACFLLDERVLRYPRYRDPSGVTWIRDTDLAVWYALGASGVRIVAAADGRGARVALMRVVRELAMHGLTADGAPLLHAAGVVRDGRALIVCGPRRAGKTTLLLRLLREPGVRYLANDRVAVLASGGPPGERGPAVSRGLPTIVALRPGTLALLPELMERLTRARPDHWRSLAEDQGSATSQAVGAGAPITDPVDLSPAQLCRAVGVEPVAAAIPAAIVFPAVDPAARRVTLQRLDAPAARARLRGATVGGLLGLRPARALAVGSRPSRPARRGGMGAIPAYAVHLGVDVFHPGGADPLLELLR